METKAHFILIGVFTLLVLALGFGFVLWSAQSSMDRHVTLYDIHFEGSVSGLTQAGDVLFNGVKVGQVKDIEINRNDPGKVRVRIEVDADTPIRTDSKATLEMRGITGLSVVQISGGSPKSPMLEPPGDNEIASIPSAKSNLAELVTSAPDLVNQGIQLLNKLNEVAGPENREAVASILANVETLSATLADNADTITAVIQDVRNTTNNLSQASGKFAKVMENADTLLHKDVAEAFQSITQAADDLDTLLVSAQPGVEVFSAEGLQTFTRFVAEARQLVATLDRLARNLESDSFLGSRVPEYETQ